MQKSGERKGKGRPTLAADSTAGPPERAGRSPGSRAGARDSGSGSAADLRRPLPLPRGGLSFPGGKTGHPPPEAVSRGSRWRGSGRHLQEDLLLGQERQVLEGRQDRGQRAARRPRPPRRPLRDPSPGRIPRTWYSASSSLDRRLPEPPIAAPRAQFRQLVSGLRQLSHFRPRAASPPRPHGNRPCGGPPPRVPPPPYGAQRFPAGPRRRLPALGGPWRFGGVVRGVARGVVSPQAPPPGRDTPRACARAALAQRAPRPRRSGCSSRGRPSRGASSSPAVGGGGGLG